MFERFRRKDDDGERAGFPGFLPFLGRGRAVDGRTKAGRCKAVGLHRKTPDETFDAKQLVIGTNIEMEHTDSEELAREIAKDHLAEIPDYYTRLIKMESEAKK